MRTLINYKSAIWVVPIVFMLLEATWRPVNATNSTTTTTILPKRTNNKSVITSIPKLTKKNLKVATLSLNLTELRGGGTKKDKRQAQRGYTDIPLDERGFDITNSSPAPLVTFDTNIPVAASTSNDLAFTTPSYLPERKPGSSFYAPKVGFPSNVPRLSDLPAAAATSIVEQRRDDYFDSNGNMKSVPGEPGIDYPNFSSIPETSFSCKSQQWPGYYADPEARCQVFWICEKQARADGKGSVDRAHSFLCPIGTVFNQQVFVCDWWWNVDCNTAQGFYSRNQFLYTGPGVGIDGRPTRLAGGFANPGLSTVPNQVLSSNQIARLAGIGSGQIAKSHPPQITSSFSIGSQDQNQNYVSQQSQQKYNAVPSSQNQVQDQSQRYQSHQTMLSNRMHKNAYPSPTPNPEPSLGNNLFTGGFEQPKDSNQRAFNNNNFGQNQASQSQHRLPPTPRPHDPVYNTAIPVTQSPPLTQKAVLTFSGTISSTARPISINTEIPTYNHGSSTLHTPRDQNQNRQYQNSNRNTESATNAPITTTFRSSGKTYSSSLGFAQNPSQSENVGNKQIGSIGTARPGGISSTPQPFSTPSPTNSGFIPSPTITSPYNNPPPRSHTSNKPYVDRFAFSQSSTTAAPFHEGGPGQRSNEYVNANGQREIMYSPSSINANIEYPYSPSQQKNKQRLLELEALKNVKASGKEYFSYPHFHGQRSNAYSDFESTTLSPAPPVNAITDQQPMNYPHHHQHEHNVHSQTHPVHQHVQRDSPPPAQLQQYHEVPQQQQQQHTNGHAMPGAVHTTPEQHRNAPPTQALPAPVTASPTPPQVQQQFVPQSVQYAQHPQQQNGFGSSPPPQQHYDSFIPIHGPQQNQPANNNQQHQFHQNAQQHSFNQNTQQETFVQFSPQLNNHNHVQQPQQFQHPQQIQHPQHHVVHQPVQGPSPEPPTPAPKEHFHIFTPTASPSPSTPFHQQVIEVPSQNIQLPAGQQYFQPPLNPISANVISTTESPAFSKQILSYNPNYNHPANVIVHQYLASPTPAPNGLTRPTKSRSGLSTTMKPPPAQSPFPPFTNEGFSFSPIISQSPDIYSQGASFIASPTQIPITSSSPGHRQNAFVPHSHIKHRPKQTPAPKQHKQPKLIQYPNAEIATTIKYPEGTGSLKLGVPGASSTRRLVEFSYSAHPKGTIKSSTKTTPFPTVIERFNNNFIVSSTTRRPVPLVSTTTPYFKETSSKKGSGARLAGSVTNRSTSSTSAIYVDTSAVAESSTPISVSVPPSTVTQAPAVSTANFGLKISTMAKKKMAGAWHNYAVGSSNSSKAPTA